MGERKKGNGSHDSTTYAIHTALNTILEQTLEEAKMDNQSINMRFIE